MLYKDGDVVVVSTGKQLRYAKIVCVQPESRTYLVPVDHGNGGFHYVQEEDIKAVDQVNPEDVYVLSNRVPSWYGEVKSKAEDLQQADGC